MFDSTEVWNNSIDEKKEYWNDFSHFYCSPALFNEGLYAVTLEI